MALLAAGQGQSLREPLPAVAFPEWRFVDKDDDMEEYGVAFPSAMATAYRQNNVVPVSAFLPADRARPAPVVVVLHYWGARDLRTERIMARELARKGIASAVVTLPYHLQRTPPGYSSGQLTILPDPDHLIATMTQCVLDVRRTVDWICSRSEFDHSRIGLSGVSLGALVASYVYAVEPRIDLGAFLLGGADLAHILWNSSLVAGDREKLRKGGYTEEKLREKLAPIEPLNVLRERNSGKAFVVGANFDTVIPRVDTEKLIEALPGRETLWIDTGHYGGIFVQRRLARLVADFFSKEFAGIGFEAPRGIYAPTVRIGVLANTEDGFQIGVGLDAWRAGDRGSFFGAVLVTPTQPAVFMGYRFDDRFVPGVFFDGKRASLGLFWSVVL